MTRREAEQTAARLARRYPDWTRYQWSARQAPDGDWVVVKAGTSSDERAGPGKARLEAASAGRPPEDPRRVLLQGAGRPHAG